MYKIYFENAVTRCVGILPDDIYDNPIIQKAFEKLAKEEGVNLTESLEENLLIEEIERVKQ